MGSSQEYIKNVRCYKEIINDCNIKATEKIRIIINDLIDIENEHNRFLHQNHKQIDKNNVAIGNIYERDGAVGCVAGIDGWYVYCFYDRNEDCFIGPFDLYGVIKALACRLCVGNGIDFIKFTEEEEYIYLNKSIHYDDFCKKRSKSN